MTSHKDTRHSSPRHVARKSVRELTQRYYRSSLFLASRQLQVAEIVTHRDKLLLNAITGPHYHVHLGAGGSGDRYTSLQIIHYPDM
jgi:hypothetical protein